MYDLQHPCIEWEGVTSTDGYGVTRLNVGMNQVGAHRVAYCVEHGLDLDDVKGLLIRHKCDNPSCVQPMHLEPGTSQDNHHDAMKRGRHSAGMRHGMRVLDEDDVRRIRSVFTKGCRTHGRNALAKEYGVAPITITKVVTKQTWRHV